MTMGRSSAETRNSTRITTERKKTGCARTHLSSFALALAWSVSGTALGAAVPWQTTNAGAAGSEQIEATHLHLEWLHQEQRNNVSVAQATAPAYAKPGALLRSRPPSSFDALSFSALESTVTLDIPLSHRLSAGALFRGALSPENRVRLDAAQIDPSLTLFGSFATSNRSYVDLFTGYSSAHFEPTATQGGTDPLTPREWQEPPSYGQWIAGVGTGYRYQRGLFRVSPHLQMDVLRADAGNRAGADSTSPGGIDDGSFSSLTSTLGLVSSVAIRQAWGTLIPRAELSLVHEFDRDSRVLDDLFGTGYYRSTLGGQGYGGNDSYVVGGLSFITKHPSGVQTFIDYRSLFRHEDLSDYALRAGVRVEF
jgi:hypothetical protein